MTFSKGTKLLLLSLLASSSAFSANESITSSALFNTLKQGELALTVGAFRSTQGESQHINIQGLIGDDFSVSGNHDNNGLAGIAYFVPGNTLYHLNMSYGLSAFYLAQSTVTGLVTQENLFTNLSYQYDLTNYPVYVMAKSTFNLQAPFALSVDVGVGPNFMKANGFQESSLDGVTLPDVNIFSSHTTATLSATIGASVRINHVIGQMPVDIGYRFFYLGEGHFDAGNSQVQDQLDTGNVYANALFVSISL